MIYVLLYVTEGVEVFANVTATAVESGGNGVKVTTSNGIEVGDHMTVM